MNKRYHSYSGRVSCCCVIFVFDDLSVASYGFDGFCYAASWLGHICSEKVASFQSSARVTNEVTLGKKRSCDEPSNALERSRTVQKMCGVNDLSRATQRAYRRMNNFESIQMVSQAVLSGVNNWFNLIRGASPCHNKTNTEKLVENPTFCTVPIDNLSPWPPQALFPIQILSTALTNQNCTSSD
ncbi:hypothetical protein TNCV_3971981 [Trichonephila clavipes]|nr:hypothetical protein TNCV_3971981 [Trichonephila clavipes]